MPALSDPTTWRTSPYTFTPYLWIDRPQVIFAARVNQASFTFPLTEITFDTVTTGAYTDVLKDMTLLIGSSAGADDLGRVRIRKVPTSSILYIQESSNGTRDGELNPSDNSWITILEEYRIWTIAPRYASGVAWKDYDRALIESGRNYGSRPGPMANGGCWRAALVDPITDLATFDFSSSDSANITPSATTASLLWNVKDGTITVGTSASASITATFPVGRRYVTLTITDSNGDTHTHQILVVTLDPDDATYKPIRDFGITERRLTRDGAVMSFVVHEDLAPATFPEGAAVIYFEVEKYGSTEGSLAGPATCRGVKFVGWLDSEREEPEASERGIERGTEFRCISHLERLKRVNLLPQLIATKASPSDWKHMASLTTGRVLWYLLMWQSTLLNIAPVILLDIGVSYKRWATQAGTLYDQAQDVSKSRARVLTCDMRGIIRELNDPLLLDSGSRTSTEIVALTADDYSAVEIERDRHPREYWVDGSGIVAGTKADPLFSQAPGTAPGQGAARRAFDRQVASNQTELNSRTGHEYARVNAPYLGLRVPMVHTGDAGIDPALMEWVSLTLASTTNHRQRSFSAGRMLPLEVGVQYSNDAQRTKEVELSLFPETVGQPAATITREKGGSRQSYTIPGYVNHPPFAPATNSPGSFNLRSGIELLAAFGDNNTLNITTDFQTPFVSGGPTWVSTALSVSGTILAWTVDPWSPGYFAGAGSAINGWLLTTTSIYRIVDIFGAQTLTLQLTLAGTLVFGDIMAPWGQQNWVIANLDYSTNSPQGNHCAYTTDGVNWTEVTISPTASGSVSGNSMETPGLYALSRIPGTAYAAAKFSTTACFLYKTTDYGATWGRQPSLDASRACGAIHVPWNDNAAQDLIYYHYRTTTPANFMRMWDGASLTTITPSTDYGPRFRQWAIYASPTNRQVMLVVGSQEAGSDGTRPFISTDGGANWTAHDIHRITDNYYAGAIGGDNDQVCFLWGANGRISYSSDQCATIDDRRGNIVSLSPGAIVGIAGGPV